MDLSFLHAPPLNGETRFCFNSENLFLEKLESPLILFYFKRENKTRKKTLKK